VGEKKERHNDQDGESGYGGGIVTPRLAVGPDGQASNQRDKNKKTQDEKSAHYSLPKNCQPTYEVCTVRALMTRKI
jgi:hypothetical protein